MTSEASTLLSGMRHRLSVPQSAAPSATSHGPGFIADTLFGGARRCQLRGTLLRCSGEAICPAMVKLDGFWGTHLARARFGVALLAGFVAGALAGGCEKKQPVATVSPVAPSPSVASSPSPAKAQDPGLGAPLGIDTSLLDRQTRPCDDFYRY